MGYRAKLPAGLSCSWHSLQLPPLSEPRSVDVWDNSMGHPAKSTPGAVPHGDGGRDTGMAVWTVPDTRRPLLVLQLARGAKT